MAYVDKSRSSIARRTRSSFLIGFVLVGVSLAIAPTVSANPAPGPGAESRIIAGALPAGVVPDGTCAARVTAVGGGGASSPAAAETGGVGGAGASISATFGVLPGQSFGGSVGGGGAIPTGGSGDGAVGDGGDGGTIGNIHQGGGGGGRTSVSLAGSTVLVAGGGGGGGAAHDAAPAGFGGGGGFAVIAAGTVSPGSNGQTGVDAGATANGGQGGQVAAGGAGGTNTANAALNGAAGGGIGVGTGGNGGPDPDFDSGGGGGGGYTGGGGGASTISSGVSGAGGGGGSSWVSLTSPTVVGAAPTAVSGAAGPASPAGTGPGATGSIAIDWVPCLYGLTVDKSVSSATVNAGGAVIWTVTITNAGLDPMTRGDTVDLTDLLPVGPNGAPAPAFEVLTFNVSGGANLNLTRGPVTCSGVTVGSTMPATTNCSRAYSGAPGAPGAPTGGLRGLDVGESITITYEQIIANTAPCATITNTASVQDRATTSGTTDLVGVIATRSDSASLTIACYDLAITKVASPSLVRAGGTITWTVTVTNEGPGAMVGPTATDANPLVVTDVFPSTNVGAASLVSAVGPAGSCNLSGSTVTCASGLPAGGQEVLTFTQLVSGSAPIGAVISNTASVTDPRTGDTNDSSTDQATVASAELSLVKSADPISYSAVGEVIAYEFLVTNSGNTTLSGPFTVDDDLTTDESCPATPTLAPTASIICTASYTITQADLDAGSVTNTATVSGDGVTSAPDSATVTVVAGPALTIAKSADVATYAAVGDVIAYDFLVTNSGNTTLSGPFTIDDDVATDESCPATPTLAPAASITCTASYTITQADLDAGSVTNSATATNGTVTSNTDSVTVTAATGPGLSLVKTASPATFDTAGDVIDYDYVVTNTGNVSLQGPVVVTDDKATVTCPDLATVGDLDANLDPGESITCTASYTVTQADVEADGVTNIATASAGGVDSAVESETVTIAGAPTPPPPTVPPTTTIPNRPSGSPDATMIAAAWLMIGILASALVIPRPKKRKGARKAPE